MGNLDTALEALDKAVQKIELLRAQMTEPSYRATYFATTRDAYELTIDIHMRLSQREQNNDSIKKAFEVSESARARSLLDILVESKTDITPENNPALLEEKRRLLAHIAEKNRASAQLYANASLHTQAAKVEQELAELVMRRKNIESILRAANARYAAMTQPEPSKLPEIQRLLDAETMLLEYSLGDDKSYLWAITTDSIYGFQLPPQAEIEKIARQVYELLIAPNQLVKGETNFQYEMRVSRAKNEYPKVAHRLTQMILAPVASLLDKKRLVIVADGALQYIPFAALPALALQKDKAESLPTDEVHLLIEDHEIIYLLSASVLSAIRNELERRKPARKAIAVIADPVFNKADAKLRRLEIRQGGNSQSQTRTATLQRAFRQMEIEGNKLILDRLPFSHEEAMAILSIAPQGESLGLLNFQANKQTVISSELNQYRFVHFATHGLLNSNRPELSKIFLSLVDQEGKPQDGFLQLHDIYKLRLPAELVVLSACQTALGKEIKGEGLVDLTRGFMYAGAARVVASLWNVNDAATAELMSHFYKHMLQDR
jgi:CHAT domain-containing protein